MSTILIADDQPDNLRVLFIMLRKTGHELIFAENGRIAVDIALAQPVDLILMDVMMPELDGLQATLELRQFPQTEDLPVIFISALTDISDKMRAFEVGAVDYLTKPFNVQELLTRVNYQLDLAAKRKAIRELVVEKEETIAQLEQEIVRRTTAETALQVANQRLMIVNHLTALTHQRLNSTFVLASICEQLYNTTHADFIFALRLRENPEEVCLEAAYPSVTHPLEELQQYLPRQLTVAALRRQNYPLMMSNPNEVTLFEPLLTHALDMQARSIMLTPITIHGNVAAVLGLCRSSSAAFSHDDIVVVQEFCQIAAQPLDNSLLHEQLTVHNAQLGGLVDERTEQLNRLNQRTSAILANVVDSIVLTDANGIIDMTNNGFNNRFGYTPDALFGRPAKVLTVPEHADALEHAMTEAKPNQPQSLQLTMVRADGTPFDADVSIAIINSRTPEPQYVITCHDVSSFKELERLKDGFISTVTHELRTPIAGIQLIANQLHQYDDRMDAAMRSRKHEQLVTQSRVMAELIESVLDIARMENRRMKNSPHELVNMARLLHETAEEQLPSSHAKQQTLDILIDDQVIEIPGDNDELKRVWRNLISNAIKYTPEGGKVLACAGWASRTTHITCASHLNRFMPLIEKVLPEGNFMVGVVKDNGHGMDTEQLEKMFTRFYRGWARQSKIPGTGLGLSLVKEQLVAYGGDIHVESELNVGSTFIFWLPVNTNN